MEAESDTTIARPRAEVFEFLAHAERLPEYVDEFAWVKRRSEGKPRSGFEYAYKMERGGAEGTFEWTAFEPHERLEWGGPAIKSGPGSVAPAGRWELSDEGHSTHVKLVMATRFGGALKLLAPVMRPAIRRGNARALKRLKERLEGSARTV